MQPALEESNLQRSKAWFGNERSILLAFRRVRILGESGQLSEELRRLANEESHRGQKVDHAHGSPLCLGRANNRTSWESAVEESARLGHDEVRLEGLPTEGRTV